MNQQRYKSLKTTYADSNCSRCQGKGIDLSGGSAVECSCLRPSGDAIHRSKIILELVDQYAENQTQHNRNLLRVALFQHFTELIERASS